MYRISLALLLVLALALGACATNKPRPEPPNPMVMNTPEGVFLNTFTLEQSDFPITGHLEALPSPPEFVLPDRKDYAENFKDLMAKHGYKTEDGHSFRYGRIHVRLDGYDAKRKVGFLFVAKDDYEEPRELPKSARTEDESGAKSSKGLFFTVRSPDKVSIPELLMLARLVYEERLYLALVNLHQFAVPSAGDGDAKTARLAEFKDRAELFLRWVDARLALRETGKTK